MREGEHWRLYLHPRLAYGTGGYKKTVAPGEAVVFDLQLLKIYNATEAAAGRAKAAAAAAQQREEEEEEEEGEKRTVTEEVEVEAAEEGRGEGDGADKVDEAERRTPRSEL